MTSRNYVEVDCRPPQVLRQSYIANFMERLIGYAYLEAWRVHRYMDSVTFISKDGKRELKLDSDLIFTINVIRGKGDVKSSKWSCKTVDEAWSMCDSTLKAYR